MAFEPRSPRLRRVLVTAGILAIAILIWTMGPLIAVAGHPILASRTARLACIAIVVAIAIVRIKLHAWRKARADRRLAEGLATDGRADAPAATRSRRRMTKPPSWRAASPPHSRPRASARPGTGG